MDQGQVEVQELTREEGIELFDLRARRCFGMSGEEWLRRYDADEFDFEGDDHCALISQEGLIPFTR